MPVTIVDALLPDLGDRTAVSLAAAGRERSADLDALVRAVGFAMQPKIYPRCARRPRRI